MAADVGTLRRLLEEEYGIKSDSDLQEALNRMTKVNIGSLVSKPARKEGKDNAQESRSNRIGGSGRNSGQRTECVDGGNTSHRSNRASASLRVSST